MISLVFLVGDTMYSTYIKRIADFILSLLGLIVLSPIILVLCIIIKVTSPGPILFRQTRTGKENQPFQIYKFRTMYIDTPKDVPTHLLDNPDQYITPIGKFMRKTSLDELPQLWNILIGDMAIVGPRPSLLNQTDLNALRDENGASSVRPGLTGLAQINGRDELPIDVKANFDGQYVQHITFMKDVKILLGTVLAVVKHDGVQEGKSE